jgi:transcriptional regulator
MNRRKPTYFRNSLDLRDKVQVKVLRKRLKLSDQQFASILQKTGNSISAITKEANTSKAGETTAVAAVTSL